MDDKARKVLDSLQAQCARREYCVSDIRLKAVRKLDGDTQAAEEIVESLVADRFVSDLRYAGAFAREKASLSGWGPVKIREVKFEYESNVQETTLTLRQTTSWRQF